MNWAACPAGSTEPPQFGFSLQEAKLNSGFINRLHLETFRRRNSPAYQQFESLYRNSATQDAIRIGQTLLAQCPCDARLRKRLARLMGAEGEIAAAQELLLEGLDKGFTQVVDRLAEELEKRQAGGFDIAGNWALRPEGGSTAIVEHFDGDSRHPLFISKFSSPSDCTSEIRFYEQLAPHLPRLNSIIPEVVWCGPTSMDGLHALTFRYIPGQAPSGDDVHQVLRSINQIGNIRLERRHLKQYSGRMATDYFRNIRRRLAGRLLLLPEAFGRIQDRMMNRLLITSLRRRHGCNRQAHGQVWALIQRLEDLVLGKGLYKRVVPEKHFGLVHGDLHPKNVIVDRDAGQIRFLDWAAWRTGPPCIDLVRFMETEHAFTVVDELTRSSSPASTMNDAVGKALLVYCWLVWQLNQQNSDMLESRFDGELENAIERLEELVNA